jgi:hypothetical protein
MFEKLIKQKAKENELNEKLESGKKKQMSRVLNKKKDLAKRVKKLHIK